MENEGTAAAGDSILEPLTAYKTQFESAFRRNCEEYFDGLVEKSGIDLVENRRTVNAYLTQSRLAEESARMIARNKALRAFLICLIVFGAVFLVIGILLLLGDYIVAGAVLCALGPVCIVLGAVLLAKVVIPRIKKGEEEHEKRQKKANETLQQAWQQMEPLNALFENKITHKLIEKTVPLIELDDYFNVRRYDYLSGKYGYGSGGDVARSTIGILTGQIVGNPFVVDRELVRTMGSCTYTGSIVIHWETRERDSQGNWITQHHSQTLTASVTHPKPYYSSETRLIYGNEAAPALHFSRRPAHAEDLSEKECENKVKKGVKAIRKKQKNAMASGTAFTEMGNEEFDVLFGALDRDNDVEFRLLFTPLAQKNLLALMKDPDSYGDDFYMRKSGCLNYIVSEHSAQWDMNETRERYYSYSADRARSQFLTFNEQYFRSLYFDLAPLLSIPLYQQHKPHEYIYQEDYPRNYTEKESEFAVNGIDAAAFAPHDAATPSILKTTFLGKDGESDRVRVTAHAYSAVSRIDYVSVYGGDGNYHSVPVEWTEYIPVTEDTDVEMKDLGLSDREFFAEANSGKYRDAMSKYNARAFAYRHGILCCVVPEGYSGFDADFTVKKS